MREERKPENQSWKVTVAQSEGSSCAIGNNPSLLGGKRVKQKVCRAEKGKKEGRILREVGGRGARRPSPGNEIA